jgi:peptide deformylase
MFLPVPHESKYQPLHEPSAEVVLDEIKSAKMKKFIADLIETMYKKNGVGIASVQVANPIRLCVIAKDFTPEKKEDLVLINPKFSAIGILRQWDEEGCLSVPLVYGKVRRYRKIKVTALDINGKRLEFVAKDFFARICQHEIDHLNGILFIDKAKNLRTIDKTVA